MGSEVTYSINVFLPITNICRNRCWYCGFRREVGSEWARFMRPEEVAELLELAKGAGCSEALFTLGERPEVHEDVRRVLGELGYRGMTDYLEDLCKLALTHGLLPHTNAGVLSERELRQLRRWNASMGLMLECVAELPAHRESPGKDPKLRLETIETAGKLKIPFTTGLLIGIGESFEDRARSLLELMRVHEQYGHIQEIIVQPFMPKPGTPMESCPSPSEEELLAVVAVARLLMPSMNIQVAPNLVRDVKKFLMAGANDLGGISPVTPDFINPERAWPKLKALGVAIRNAGFIPRERLPIYPRFARDPSFVSDEVYAVLDELMDESGYRRLDDVR
ncbi:MAG: 7,8-didemethyl-8-hydroxy-5-deazariboflavin synthase CofG [Hadesarchaea archaeon]|nr:7,8-didemethyl-8-hydroxy-5-deazariboflavin synthase CofG [Hadesarchaea archaeon]